MSVKRRKETPSKEKQIIQIGKSIRDQCAKDFLLHQDPKLEDQQIIVESIAEHNYCKFYLLNTNCFTNCQLLGYFKEVLV